MLYPEHLPLSKIQTGIKSGSFIQGTFRASRDNYLEATVFIQKEGDDSTEVCENLAEIIGFLPWTDMFQLWSHLQGLYFSLASLFRFLFRVYSTSTEQCTKMWLLCSCCRRASGWRHPRLFCRMMVQQKMTVLKKERKRKLWVGFWVNNTDTLGRARK